MKRVVLLGPGDIDAVGDAYSGPGYYVLEGEEIVDGPYQNKTDAEKTIGLKCPLCEREMQTVKFVGNNASGYCSRCKKFFEFIKVKGQWIKHPY